MIPEITILDITITLIIIFVSFILSIERMKEFNKYFSLVVIAHYLITGVYYIMTVSTGGDSITYFRKALSISNWFEAFDTGTDFIVFIIYPLINYLHLSFLGIFFIFSFVGLIGFYLLFKIIVDITSEKWSPFFLLLLSPNLHFWTVALGKDSIVFCCICTIVYLLYFKKGYIYFVIPLLFLSIIRFHIFTFISFAYALTVVVFNNQIKRSLKVILFLAFFGIGIAIFPIFIERIGLDDISNLDAYSERITNANFKGGGAIDMQNANIIVKWFSYMFRPLFFDAANTMAVMVSFDNLIWLIAYVLTISKFFRQKIKLDNLLWFCIISIFAISIPLSFGLSNLGIAVRQKTMVIPFVLILIIAINNYNQYKYNE